MKRKLNTVLAVFLILQLTIIFVFDKPWTSGYSRAQTGTEEEKALFPGVSSETVASFTITRGGKQKIAFEKQGEEDWVIKEQEKDYRADIEWIVRLLDSISRARKSDIVSTGRDNWATYEVDEENGFHVLARDSEGKTIADLIIGKTMGPMKGTFLRVDNSEDVMLVMENIRRAVNKGKNWLRAWRDRTVHFDLKEKNFLSLRVVGPHGPIVIEHRAAAGSEKLDHWVMTEPEEGAISADTMGKLLNPVCTLKAKGFMPPGTKLADVGLAPPPVEVSLIKKGGETIVFKISKGGVIEGKKSIRCIAASCEPGEIFKVSSVMFHIYSSTAKQLIERNEKDSGAAQE